MTISRHGEQPLRPFILGCEYDADSRRLTVRFLTATYVYSKVPKSKGEAMTSRTEIGDIIALFDSAIEGKYPSERVSV
jgi:hypothetical protein